MLKLIAALCFVTYGIFGQDSVTLREDLNIHWKQIESLIKSLDPIVAITPLLNCGQVHMGCLAMYYFCLNGFCENKISENQRISCCLSLVLVFLWMLFFLYYFLYWFSVLSWGYVLQFDFIGWTRLNHFKFHIYSKNIQNLFHNFN